MNSQDITRKDVFRRKDTRYEAVGPTPIYEHVDRELKRIANVWGTKEKGWTCRFDAAGCVLSAYVGKPSCIVAVAHHADSREGLKRLLASLFEVDGQ
jgi:hypothetical protein